jgi:hypothetical protein
LTASVALQPQTSDCDLAQQAIGSYRQHGPGKTVLP